MLQSEQFVLTPHASGYYLLKREQFVLTQSRAATCTLLSLNEVKSGCYLLKSKQSVLMTESRAPSFIRRCRMSACTIANAAAIPFLVMRVSCRYAWRAFSHTPG